MQGRSPCVYPGAKRPEVRRCNAPTEGVEGRSPRELEIRSGVGWQAKPASRSGATVVSSLTLMIDTLYHGGRHLDAMNDVHSHPFSILPSDRH